MEIPVLYNCCLGERKKKYTPALCAEEGKKNAHHRAKGGFVHQRTARKEEKKMYNSALHWGRKKRKSWSPVEEERRKQSLSLRPKPPGE
jgi:hypothetical protein